MNAIRYRILDLHYDYTHHLVLNGLKLSLPISLYAKVPKNYVIGVFANMPKQGNKGIYSPNRCIKIVFNKEEFKLVHNVGFNILKFFITEHLLKRYSQLSVEDITILKNFVYQERLNWINANSEKIKFTSLSDFNIYIGNYYLENPCKNYNILKKWIIESMNGVADIYISTHAFSDQQPNYGNFLIYCHSKNAEKHKTKDFSSMNLIKLHCNIYDDQPNIPRLPEIKDKILLQKIFMPKSIDKNIYFSNKRLELLGDSVLGLVMIQIIYKFGDELSFKTCYLIWKTLTSNNHLKKWSSMYKFSEILQVNKKTGELKSKSYADIFEIYLGCLYLQLNSFDEIELWLKQLCEKELQSFALE
ncbi:hypothetical protein QEN19_003733 [Hanseniaspora menglaensis]